MVEKLLGIPAPIIIAGAKEKNSWAFSHDLLMAPTATKAQGKIRLRPRAARLWNSPEAGLAASPTFGVCCSNRTGLELCSRTENYGTCGSRRDSHASWLPKACRQDRWPEIVSEAFTRTAESARQNQTDRGERAASRVWGIGPSALVTPAARVLPAGAALPVLLRRSTAGPTSLRSEPTSLEAPSTTISGV